MATRSTQPDSSIIALDKFILATRDSGYKGTASAISELVDNSIQAGAKQISIAVRQLEGDDSEPELQVSVLDDGVGMDPFTLRQALRFGGSSRFDDRSGLGRYGMGLPNSSLSQARRVTVYTWQSSGAVYSSYLDVDEIANGEITEVPAPRRNALPIADCKSESGTLVLWSRCDRLDNRRVSTTARKLGEALGQTFRFFLWEGTQILINEQPVKPFDPLFLRRDPGEPTAELFGEPIDYEVRTAPEGRKTGKVRVTFSELPIHEWHNLTNEQKRELGISKGAGISIVRAGREVDYGWFFMGSKRRENYDDWFRCEVEFDASLDEAFGITHTKQQVRPQQFVLDALSGDIEATAHALNSRIRKAHAIISTADRAADSEQVATRRDHILRPLPARIEQSTANLASMLRRKHPVLRQRKEEGDRKPSLYKFVEHDLKGTTDFFAHASVDGRFVVVLNPSHPFYKRVYKPLAESDQPKDKALRSQLELLLMAASRAAAAVGTGKALDDFLARFKKEWSDTLAVFLND